MSQHALKADQPAAFASDEAERLLSTERVSASVLPVVLLVGAAIALVCVMFWTHALGSSRCYIRLAPYVLGITSEIAATVPAGVPCTIAIRPGSTAIEALAIESHPKFGTLTPRGRTGVIYRPHNGAGGSDAFAFAIYGGGAAPMQKFVVRVSTEAK
jgi:hypothetical protein